MLDQTLEEQEFKQILKRLLRWVSYAMTAITAVTSQNITGVRSVIAVPPREIEKQILFTSKDIKPDGIKIGMLHSTEVILSVIKALNKIKTKNNFRSCHGC